MLLQIHHEFEDGHTEMVAQKDVLNNEDYVCWKTEIEKEHPLPSGAKWMVCNEKSKHFVMTAEPTNPKEQS